MVLSCVKYNTKYWPNFKGFEIEDHDVALAVPEGSDG